MGLNCAPGDKAPSRAQLKPASGLCLIKVYEVLRSLFLQKLTILFLIFFNFTSHENLSSQAFPIKHNVCNRDGFYWSMPLKSFAINLV